jgi:hypothetical protein
VTYRCIALKIHCGALRGLVTHMQSDYHTGSAHWRWLWLQIDNADSWLTARLTSIVNWFGKFNSDEMKLIFKLHFYR